jgi:phospholipase/carboxylesterase
VEALALPADLPVRHLLPDAPERPITINMGYRMRGWYDIKSFEDPADRAVESHVRESAARIASLIEQLVAEGFAPERIVLAGFSQGRHRLLHRPAPSGATGRPALHVHLWRYPMPCPTR